MEELELSEDLLRDVIDFMLAKKYPYNTTRVYGYGLKRLWRNNKVLNKKVVMNLLKEYKHQNQRAILVLINRYCYFNGINFKIELPRVVRKKSKITVKTTPESEIEIMINSAPKPYNLMLKCIFKIGGGLRISEAIKLSWYHFLWADWLKNKALGAVLIKDSKGDDRIIPVPKELMEEIYGYAKANNKLNEFGIPIGGMLFAVGHDYKPQLKINNIELWKDKYVQYAYNWFRYNIIKKHCEKAVGHPVKIHSLRHTRATQLYDEKDVPIEIIQQLLGHKEITTTMIYTRVSNKKVFDAMKNIS